MKLNWRCSSGWLKQIGGGLMVALLISACATQKPASILDPRLLPKMPDYEVAPIELPCNMGVENRGQRRCRLTLIEDDDAIIKTLKEYCFILFADRIYCRMGSRPQ